MEAQVKTRTELSLYCVGMVLMIVLAAIAGAVLWVWLRVQDWASEDPWLPEAIAIGGIGALVYSAFRPGVWW